MVYKHYSQQNEAVNSGGSQQWAIPSASAGLGQKHVHALGYTCLDVELHRESTVYKQDSARAEATVTEVMYPQTHVSVESRAH